MKAYIFLADRYLNSYKVRKSAVVIRFYFNSRYVESVQYVITSDFTAWNFPGDDVIINKMGVEVEL